jgi:CheY-like chemotaxis protein
MKLLLADDDLITRMAVSGTLTDWGYEVVCCHDGETAWAALQQDSGPRLALLDWQMPGLDGLEICRRIRNSSTLSGVYVILLTARDSKSDVLEGLTAGADDYIAKPFDREELRLRLTTGQRILSLQTSLAERVTELEAALAQVKQLRGILPICSYCKKIRNDRDYWEQVEAFIASETDARFSHGICPDCYDSRIKPELEQMHRHAPPYPQDSRTDPR